METEKRLDGAIIRDNTTGITMLVCSRCLRVADKIIATNPRPSLQTSHEQPDELCHRCERKVEVWVGHAPG